MSINKLIKTARKSTHRNYHHGAIVIKGGAIRASGYNHGLEHAETHAVKKLWPDTVKGCTVVVIRITAIGFGKSKPCPECYQFMRRAGISKVTYSDGKDRWITERL